MPSAPISQKTPATPIAAASRGPATSESTNEAPMLMPMTNIARVRDSRPREVREKGRHRAGDRAEPLHDARGNERRGGTRHRAQRGTRDVQEESDDDQRLATDAVRPGAEGNLHHRLRQPVGAHGEAGEERRSARQRARVKREHWQ